MTQCVMGMTMNKSVQQGNASVFGANMRMFKAVFAPITAKTCNSTTKLMENHS